MQYLFGDYALDANRCELRRTGQRIPLRPKVFDVLRYLIAQRNRVVSQQEFLEHLWPQQFVGEATLKSCIKEARRAVGDTGKAQRLIQTLHGRGYRFVAAVEEASESPPEEATRAILAPPHASAPEDLGQALAHAPVLGAAAHAGTEGLATFPEVLEGERKQVTILCCALTDARGLAVRVGSEAMYRLMRAFLALAQRVVQRYAGTLMHRLSDGFVAFFGAPVAHEDHARRAVLVALELQQRAREEPTLREPLRGASLATSMGLHTGVVIVGSLGKETQTLYAALDDTTDVAGRLQRLAGPDTILMSEATRRLVQEEVGVEASGALDSAELPHSLPVYRVRAVLVQRAGVPGRGGRSLSPFVGRTRELASLQALLTQVEAGHGQVVGIVGEPGIGKSRLLYEFARTLNDTQVEYLEERCFAYDQTTPYGPVRGILRQLCGMSGADGPEVMATKLNHCLRETGLAPDEDAPSLLQLLGLPEDTTALANLSPEVRKARTLAILRHLSLHSGQGRPRVIAVENVHWIDPTSEEYLTRLADSLSGAKLLLVTTYRPDYRPPWLDKSYATQLALPRLRPQDSRFVVQSVLHATPDAGPWEQAILDTAAGNPFFLEELAWAVREGGVAQPTAMIPDTVQAVLAARIDRLQPVEKRLLQMAAVIGHEVPLRLLQAIAELPEDVLQRGLARLQAGEFLYETRPLPDLAYTFKHALTHQVAYSSLLQEPRCTLHARIVDTLEGLYAGHLAEQVERLAYHALRGEVWDKAFCYYRQAGAMAETRSAYREAVACFEQALSVLQHLPESHRTIEQAIDLRFDLRNALLELGDHKPILEYLRQAETLAQALGDQRRLGWVLSYMTRHLADIEGYDRTIVLGKRALAIAGDVGDVSLQVATQCFLGQAYHFIGDYSRALGILKRNVASLTGELLYQRFGLPCPASVHARTWLVASLAELGAFAEGIARSDEECQIAESVNQPDSVVHASFSAGFLYLRKGDLHKAITVLERGIELCQVWNIGVWWSLIAACLGCAYALSGRVAEAVHLLEQALGQVDSQVDSIRRSRGGWNALCEVYLSEAYMLAGRREEAIQLAERTLVHAAERNLRGMRGKQAWALRLLGIIHAQSDPLAVEQAEAHYRQALALANELGMHPLQAHCHLGLGMLYSQTGQVAHARAELAAAIDRYRAMEMTFWLPQAEAALAQAEGR